MLFPADDHLSHAEKNKKKETKKRAKTNRKTSADHTPQMNTELDARALRQTEVNAKPHINSARRGSKRKNSRHFGSIPATVNSKHVAHPSRPPTTNTWLVSRPDTVVPTLTNTGFISRPQSSSISRDSSFIQQNLDTEAFLLLRAMSKPNGSFVYSGMLVPSLGRRTLSQDFPIQQINEFPSSSYPGGDKSVSVAPAAVPKGKKTLSQKFPIQKITESPTSLYRTGDDQYSPLKKKSS